MTHVVQPPAIVDESAAVTRKLRELYVNVSLLESKLITLAGVVATLTHSSDELTDYVYHND